MMTYTQWFEMHGNKHRALTQRLQSAGLSRDEIIRYFRFDNMVKKEKEFCELYKTNSKCHDMEELNCYLCACPNFRFTQNPALKDGKRIHSHCSIDSKDGALFEHEDNIHQDCSGCLVPHHEAYIKKNFDLSWFETMKDCEE